MGQWGPNWKLEFDLWLDQQNRDWTLVTHKCSYASVVRDYHQPKLQHKRKSIFQGLLYPDDYHHNYFSKLFDRSEKSSLRNLLVIFSGLRKKRKPPMKSFQEKDPVVKTVFDGLKFPLCNVEHFGNKPPLQSRDKSVAHQNFVFKGY
jgi:hypothetical protein